MANIATIGLNDIAWGLGVREVPTYGNETRQVTEVNLANIPFNETKTVGEALLEFQTQLTSADYATVSGAIAQIRAVYDSLDMIDNVYHKGHLYEAINDKFDMLTTISDNLDTLLALPTDIEDIKSFRRDLVYLIHKFTARVNDSVKLLNNANCLVKSKIDPMYDEVVATRAELQDLIATARADMIQGYEQTERWSTYRLEIVSKRNCYNPRVVIDDDNRVITWEVPTVQGNCVVQSATVDQVRDAVDAYLSTLATVGNASADEPVTVDDLEPFTVTVELYFNFDTAEEVDILKAGDFVYRGVIQQDVGYMINNIPISDTPAKAYGLPAESYIYSYYQDGSNVFISGVISGDELDIYRSDSTVDKMNQYLIELQG